MILSSLFVLFLLLHFKFGLICPVIGRHCAVGAYSLRYRGASDFTGAGNLNLSILSHVCVGETAHSVRDVLIMTFNFAFLCPF